MITSRTARIVAIATAATLVAFLVIGAWISFAAKQAENTSPMPPIDQRIARCDQETLAKWAPKPVGIDELQDVSEHCYNEILGESVLDDFTLRRKAFVAQGEQGKVMLWMVVAITISGVVLAGLQLAAAFMLAASGRGQPPTSTQTTTSGELIGTSSELTISKDKISLQSSVTGLLILTISFAFFMTYVVWVYTIDPLEQGVPPAATSQETAK